jgi:hypothetical protein
MIYNPANFSNVKTGLKQQNCVERMLDPKLVKSHLKRFVKEFATL